MALDRNEFLRALNEEWKPVVDEVPLPDGKTAFVRGLTVGENDAVSQYMRQQDSGKVPGYGFKALAIAKGVCDESGKRLFNDADANALASLPSPVATVLFDAIDRLSANTKQAQEDLAKN